MTAEHNNQPALIRVFNSGYLIALLLYLAGSIGSLCDGVIASRGLGVAELAAIGLVYPYTKTMECISLLFSSGAQVVIGRKIGQNKFEEVSPVFYTSLVFTAALAVLIAVGVSVFAAPVSRLFGAVGDTLSPTVDYLISLTIGAPAHLLTLYMIPLFQLDEKKKLIDTATIVMVVVNVSLNILFVVNHMGIKGIGYSTSISYYVALAILSTSFLKSKKDSPDMQKNSLLQGRFGISGEYLAETIKEGAPSAFKNISSIVFNTFVNHILAMAGSTEALAAFSVFKMTKFIFLSVSEAIINPVRMLQTMLREEKDHKMMRRIFRYSLLKGLSFSAILCILLWIFGRSVFSLMVSGTVLDETVTLMRWTIVVYMLNTFVCYYIAHYQAIGRMKMAYSISLVLNLATIPIFYFLGRAYGPVGVWISFALQFVIITLYVIVGALIMGRKNKGLINKLLVLPVEENQTIYDFHVESEEDAKKATDSFHDICRKGISTPKKAFYCSLALEEMIFNILEYQKDNNEPDPNIDIHIVIFDNDRMIMRIKDSSRERNPFAKYEYQLNGDGMENLGINMVKSFAREVKYSFVYGVNFISIMV